MNSLISKTYRALIDEVCAAVKPDFIENSVSEDVLEELRQLWEHKLKEAGVLDVEYPEEASSMLRIQAEPDFSSLVGSQAGAAAWGAHQQQLQQVVLQRQQQQHAYALEQAAKRQRLTTEGFAQVANPIAYNPVGHPSNPCHIPQQDGNNDDVGAQGAGEGNEDQLSEDNLDDVKVSDDEDDKELEVQDFVLATFEKVHRTKNRWKATLKGGIANIDGRDYLFNKCNGEMTF